jgi:hypothetical protein
MKHLYFQAMNVEDSIRRRIIKAINANDAETVKALIPLRDRAAARRQRRTKYL